MNFKLQFNIESMVILFAIVSTPILFQDYGVPTIITILVELALFTAFMAKIGVSERTAMRFWDTTQSLLNPRSKKKDYTKEDKDKQED